MTPSIPDDVAARAEAWSTLHRWERRMLGIELRRLGLTYGEIQAHIPVPTSTLSSWLRDVALTPRQIESIHLRTSASTRRGIPVDTQWRRRRDIEHLRSRARTFAIEHLGDPFFVAGVVLYWGEGSKTRNFVDLTNADPAALRLFIAWSRRYLGPEIEFELGLHLHEGNDEAAAMAFWREALALPAAPFGKTFVKRAGTGHRKNHLPYGVCRVRTRRAADNWNRVMAWIAVIAESLEALQEPTC